MATLAQKKKAERRMRELLESNGLPQPDEVEYGFTCIRLLWREPKLAVVIDIDEPPEGLAVDDQGASDPEGESFEDT